MTEIDRLNAYRRSRRDVARGMTSAGLLADLLDYADGYAGRPLESNVAQSYVVERWLETPRGEELASRIHDSLDPDPLHVEEEPETMRQLGAQLVDRHGPGAAFRLLVLAAAAAVLGIALVVFEALR